MIGRSEELGAFASWMATTKRKANLNSRDQLYLSRSCCSCQQLYREYVVLGQHLHVTNPVCTSDRAEAAITSWYRGGSLSRVWISRARGSIPATSSHTSAQRAKARISWSQSARLQRASFLLKTLNFSAS